MPSPTVTPQKKKSINPRVGIKAIASVGDSGNYNPIDANSLYQVRNTLLNNSTVYTQMASADTFCNQNVFPQKLSNWRVNLWNRGFKVTHPHAVVRKAYEDFINKQKLSEVVLKGFEHISRMSNACLIWREKPNRAGIEWVVFHNPSKTKIDLLERTIWISPDAEFKDAISKASSEQIRQLREKYGDKSSITKWIKYIKDITVSMGSNSEFAGMIPIRQEDGEYFLLLSSTGGDATKELKYSPCSMQSIFVDIELVKLLVDGDWATAFLLKNTLQLVKAGESITSGPMAGSQKNWAKEADLLALKTQLQKVGKAQILYTNHTVTIEFIAPDPKVFAEEKYDAVIDRICWYFGIGKYAVIGKGDGSYSSASWNIAGIRNEALTIRNIMRSHLTDFLTHPTVVRDVLGQKYPIYCHDCISQINDHLLTVTPIIKDLSMSMGTLEYSNDGWNTVINVPIKEVLPDIRSIVVGISPTTDAKPENFRLKLNSRQAITTLGAPKITWDERCLKDDKQVFTEVIGLLKQGNLDNIQALNELGYDYEQVIANKATDWKNRKLLFPVYESSNGLLTNVTEGLDDLERDTSIDNVTGNGEEGQRGRPATRGQGEEDTNDQTRPSTS
jgi:hypothetical protein